MDNTIHIFIVGFVYVLASLIFWLNSKKNVFDKGYAWIFFALFHGLDEIFDGFSDLVTNGTFTYEILKKLELVTFYLSAVFLIIGTLIKLNRIKPEYTFIIGFLLQIPILILFIVVPFELILDLNGILLTYSGISVKLTTILFGLLPAIPLALVYVFEFMKMYPKKDALDKETRKSINLVLVTSFMIILYAVSEMLTSVHFIFYYFEITAIIVILITPIEITLGRDKNIELFLLYHKDGIPVITIKFNTSLQDEVMYLVTSFLTAINVMVTSELDLGPLEKIETGNGILLLRQKEDYIYSILVKEETTAIQEKLNGLTKKLHQEISDLEVQNVGYIPDEEYKLIETVILSSFAIEGI